MIRRETKLKSSRVTAPIVKPLMLGSAANTCEEEKSKQAFDFVVDVVPQMFIVMKKKKVMTMKK